MDSKCASGEIKAGEWRQQVGGDGMSNLAATKGGRRKNAANDLRVFETLRK